MARRLIVNLTPTGMVPTREMTPHVPLTPTEIVADVLRCAGLGVSMVHVHARGPDGAPTHRKEVFAEILRGIRAERPDLVLVATTSGRIEGALEKRAEVLTLDGDAKPDMASLTLGSMNFARSASVNAPQTIEGLVRRMNDAGIRPELEVFDLGMVSYARYLADKGLLAPPFYFNVLLGNVATAQADLATVGLILAQLPRPSVVGFAGIGRTQRFATSLAVLAADAVRVGLEDNLWLDDARERLATNEELVRRVVELARVLDVPLASTAETRAALGLPHVA